MANNRYYLYCECGSNFFLGKSLGQGVYRTRPAPSETIEVIRDGTAHSILFTTDPATLTDEQFVDAMHEWIWKHLTCGKDDNGTTGEWRHGELFRVLSEYDDRI